MKLLLLLCPVSLYGQACVNPQDGSGNHCSGPTTVNSAIVAKHGDGSAADGSWALINYISDNDSGDNGCYYNGQVSFVPRALTITMIARTVSCGASDITQKNQAWLTGSIVWKDLNYKPSEMSSGHVFVAVRARMGRGWPAIWFLGGSGNTSGAAGCQYQSVNFTWNNVGHCNWNQDSGANGDSAEIDIAEQAEALGYTHVQHNVYSNSQSNGAGTDTTNTTTNFHLYTVDWSNSAITWRVDGSGGGTVSGMSPVNPMFLLIENRISPLGAPPGGVFPTIMEVTYVQVCDGTNCTAPDSSGGNTVFYDIFQTSPNRANFVNGKASISGRYLMQ